MLTKASGFDSKNHPIFHALYSFYFDRWYAEIFGFWLQNKWLEWNKSLHSNHEALKQNNGQTMNTSNQKLGQIVQALSFLIKHNVDIEDKNTFRQQSVLHICYCQ